MLPKDLFFEYQHSFYVRFSLEKFEKDCRSDLFNIVNVYNHYMTYPIGTYIEGIIAIYKYHLSFVNDWHCTFLTLC